MRSGHVHVITSAFPQYRLASILSTFSPSFPDCVAHFLELAVFPWLILSSLFSTSDTFGLLAISFACLILDACELVAISSACLVSDVCKLGIISFN